MHTIVCFGDSNTWGSIPGGLGRFPRNKRWPGVMQKELGGGFHVIEEGLPGRTTVFDDPLSAGRKGVDFLPVLLQTHTPIDLLICMLGTNDLKEHFNASAELIGNGIERMVQLARLDKEVAPKKILLMAPATVQKGDEEVGGFEGMEQKSVDVSGYIKVVAQRTNCSFVNAAEIVTTSKKDGIHLDEESHEKLGTTLASRVAKTIVL